MAMSEELTAEEQQALEAMQEDTGEAEQQQPEEQKAEAEEQGQEAAPEQSGGEEKPEFKSQRAEQDKPPEGYVPHQAMHAERVRRQELERKLQELESRLPKQEEEQPPQWVDPLEDPEGFRKYDEWRTQQIQSRIERQEQERQQQAQQAQRFQEAQRAEAEFAAQTPDYQDAVQWVVENRQRELAQMGYGQQEVAQAIQQEANQLFDAARAANMNPAELLYYRAKSAGFQGGQKAAPEQAQQAQEQIQNRAKAQESTRGLGSAGGAEQSGKVTAAQLAEMSEAELAKVPEDDIRAALGG